MFSFSYTLHEISSSEIHNRGTLRYDLDLWLRYDSNKVEDILMWTGGPATSKALELVIDRYWVFITDTNYLHVYVPDNRYAEPIFIYCNEVHSSLWFFLLSIILTTTKNCWKLIFSCKVLSSNYNKNILFIKSIISNTDINNKQNNVFRWRK